MARAYRRYASSGPVDEPAASAGTAPISMRSDEVSRDAVRLVEIDRAHDRIAVTRFAQLPALLRAGDREKQAVEQETEASP